MNEILKLEFNKENSIRVFAIQNIHQIKEENSFFFVVSLAEDYNSFDNTFS